MVLKKRDDKNRNYNKFPLSKEGSHFSSYLNGQSGNQEFAMRLRLLREKLGLSQEALAKKLGVSITALQNWESGQLPKGSHLKALGELFNISTDWLLFGEGPMYRHEKAEKPPETAEKALDAEEYVFVPLLESYVTAGPDGGLIFEPKDLYPFKKNWIIRKFGRSPEHWKALVLLQVRGDSMIPTIYPGEVALVDTWEAERLEPKSGKIYLVRLPDGSISIKRLVLKEKDGKLFLVCLSDNPNYEPFEIEVDPDRGLKYYVLGRIRWVGREVD